MPMELRKRVTKTKSTTGKSKTNLSAKKRKVEDPDKILAKLEQKETNESEGEGAGGLLCHVIYASVSQVYYIFIE